MGLALEAKGLETINIGYVGFGIVRMQIASTVSWKLGIAYRSLYSKEGMTTKDKKYIRNNFDETLVNFLFHSDCDGKMTPKECGQLYKVLKDHDIRFGDPKYDTYYENLLNMLNHCAKTRRIMRFL